MIRMSLQDVIDESRQVTEYMYTVQICKSKLYEMMHQAVASESKYV